VQLADSHCHLDDSQFDLDRAVVIERARAAGVDFMLAIGTGAGPPDLEVAIRLADAYPFIYATVGVHPNDTPKVEAETFAHLRRLRSHPKVKAIGEIGLDYHWATPKEIQTPAFIRQLEIAAAAKMPIIIHTRDAWEDTLDVLKAHWAGNGLACLMHCFTGTMEQARECLDLDFYLAFGGVTTFPKAIDIREAARIIPAERLLLETDSPYLAPLPFRGKRNEPAYLAHTAKLIAELRGVPTEELARQTTKNFARFLGITKLLKDQNVQ
jgi:TatD DNase family protein